jgi:hypothetical protein
MTLLWQSARMSIDLCAHIAFMEQWPVFALEGGSSCYGAQALEPVKVLGQSGTCTLACEGDASQYCGGLSALNAYTLTNPPWVNTGNNNNQPSALQDSGSSSGSTGAAPAPQVRSGAGSVSAGPRLTARHHTRLPRPSAGARPASATVRGRGQRCLPTTPTSMFS